MKLIPTKKSTWISITCWMLVLFQSSLILHTRAPEFLESIGLKKPIGFVMNAIGLGSTDPLFQLSRGEDRTALKKALSEIDEYSTYLSEDEFDTFSIDSKQEYEGIGVSLISTPDGVEVRNVFDGGPAKKAGVIESDLITHLNGIDIRSWQFGEVIDHIRGPRGSLLHIKVIRGENHLELTLKRGPIEVPSITNIHLTSEGILYFHIEQFGEKTAKEFIKALNAHALSPLKGLIIDLRGNTGGVFQSSLDILDAFYKRGDVMLKTKPTDSKKFKVRRARFGDPLNGIPTVILIDRNTASASEVVAGSLQSTGKAILIGEKTLGKGSIQTVYSLREGDAYKKTTSHYYLPDDSSIHKKGILPDIEIKLNQEQYHAYLIRSQSEIAPWNTKNDLVWQSAVEYLIKL